MMSAEPHGDLYIVERLLAERRRNGKTQFKVRWDGYTSADDTWEDEASILGPGASSLSRVQVCAA